MKRNFTLVAVVWVCVSAFGQQSKPHDPIVENSFSPELLMHHQDLIMLTEEQRDSVRTQVEKAQARFEELQPQLRKQLDVLSGLLKQDRVEDEKALEQLDKILRLEREMRRAQLGLAVALKNKLTPEQQAKLRDLKTRIAAGQAPSPEEKQKTLQAKIEKIQAGIQRWQDEGRDPSPIAETMQQFEPLMKAGKVKDAEALLDKVIKTLDGPNKQKTGKNDAGGAQVPSAFLERADSDPATPKALRVEIEALQAQNVAWREIAWKSCLLDGVKESRQTHKPLLLWVFIDRPIDDARC